MVRKYKSNKAKFESNILNSKIMPEPEVEQIFTENTGEKRMYHVEYWTGRYPNEKEHVTEFKAYDDNDAIKILNKSHISLVQYVLFNDKNKQVVVGN